MRRVVIAWALAAVAAAPSRAGIEITVGERGLDVRAARAPLAEVLDGLARKTRMKIVYEGARPHALVMNAAGTEVETLIFPSGGGGASGGGATAAPARSSSQRSRQHVPDDQPDVDLPDEVEPMRPAAEPHEVVPDPPKPSPPAPIAPLNPTGAFPLSPFAPTAPATPAPSPTPAATPSPNSVN